MFLSRYAENGAEVLDMRVSYGLSLEDIAEEKGLNAGLPYKQGYVRRARMMTTVKMLDKQEMRHDPCWELKIGKQTIYRESTFEKKSPPPAPGTPSQ